MHAPLAHHYPKKKSTGDVLPGPIKDLCKDLSEEILSNEKPIYNNPLVPFATHAKQVREQLTDVFLTQYKELQDAQKTLKTAFLEQEKRGKTFPTEASYLTWEGIKLEMENEAEEETEKPLEQSLQERYEIPWAFMDRSFGVAHALKQKGKFVEARSIFLFLKFLSPFVFDYWVGEATCLYFMGKWEESLKLYLFSLVLREEDAFVFFQMANCFYNLGDYLNCKEYLDECIERCQQEKNVDDILHEAIKLKDFLKHQKIA